MAEPRYKVTDGVTACEECGAVVAVTTAGGYRAGDVKAHTRFHAAMGGLARSAGILDVLTGTLAGVIAGHEAQENSH